MSEKISDFVNRNFEVKKVSKDLKEGVIYRIFVSFKIEKEAIRAIKKLPQVEPERQKRKVVGVLYSLPITFKRQYIF